MRELEEKTFVPSEVPLPNFLEEKVLAVTVRGDQKPSGSYTDEMSFRIDLLVTDESAPLLKIL